MRMPDLSTISDGVRVVRWLVEPHTYISRGERILEVETDKAIVEVESIHSAIITELVVQQDQVVPTGSIIAKFLTAEPANQPQPVPTESSASTDSTLSVGPITRTDTDAGRASFFARNRASAAKPVDESKCLDD